MFRKVLAISFALCMLLSVLPVQAESQILNEAEFRTFAEAGFRIWISPELVLDEGSVMEEGGIRFLGIYRADDPERTVSISFTPTAGIMSGAEIQEQMDALAGWGYADVNLASIGGVICLTFKSDVTYIPDEPEFQRTEYQVRYITEKGVITVSGAPYNDPAFAAVFDTMIQSFRLI